MATMYKKKKEKQNKQRFLKVCEESEINAHICHFISNSRNSTTINARKCTVYLIIKDK
jgi:hypothetical protein